VIAYRKTKPLVFGIDPGDRNTITVSSNLQLQLKLREDTAPLQKLCNFSNSNRHSKF
jgi:hypothetical protein